MAVLTILLLRCLVPRYRCFVNTSRAEKPLIGTIDPANTTGALALALLTCIKATSTAITMWIQAYCHGKLSQWHGKSHELRAFHWQLFSMKTGSLPVLSPPFNICSSFMPSKREKSKSNHRCLGRCCRTSFGNEVVHALDHCAVTLHVVADVVVIADVAEDDL